MKFKLNLHSLFLRLFLAFVFIVIISLFFSKQKIVFLFLVSIFFYFIKIRYQKIIVTNLLIFVFLLKLILYPFQNRIPNIDPGKTTIYEKHFLYGVRNLNFTSSIYNGDLSSMDEFFKKKYMKTIPKKVEIITDDLGFRNEIELNNSDYILIGDSFLHSTNISQKKILNYILLNQYGYKTYNAGLGATDISHYFETIKFFKDKMKLSNKKYVMFIFQGNDFLKYRLNDNDHYHKYINNRFLHNYFKVKIFFNFYNTLKFFSYSLNKNNFKKVHEYKIGSNNVLFKFDYIYNKKNKIPSLNNIIDQYENYLPDLIIFLPTKYEVYCDLIKENKCKPANHFSVLKNNFASTNVKVLDVTNIFKKNIKYFLENKSELLFEIDDTHLNESGVEVLAKFISKHL